jgi:uncharacterized protein YjeT (DUF2065 family)
MHKQIELLVAICFFITGFSHLLQPKAWIDFFKLLLRQGYAGVFINGFITIPLGALIVAFHNVWQGGSMIVTLIGYSYVLKSAIAFCFPAIGYKSMSRVNRNNLTEFRYAGVLLLVLGGVILYFYYTAPFTAATA